MDNYWTSRIEIDLSDLRYFKEGSNVKAVFNQCNNPKIHKYTKATFGVLEESGRACMGLEIQGQSLAYIKPYVFLMDILELTLAKIAISRYNIKFNKGTSVC